MMGGMGTPADAADAPAGQGPAFNKSKDAPPPTVPEAAAVARPVISLDALLEFAGFVINAAAVVAAALIIHHGLVT
jgi:hypothetical protein